MLVKAGDEWMAKQWEGWMYPGLLAEWIAEGSLVFDIGANIGKMTYAYLSLGARVIVVEPQSVCIEQLTRRFGSDERVTIVRAACGEKIGEATITTYGNGGTISTLVPGYYWQPGGPWQNTPHDGREVVDMTTLDALIEEYGVPDFIKIDVEGYEVQVFQGLSQFVPLSFEFHPFFAPHAILCMDRILELEPKAEFNHTVGEALTYSGDWMTRETMILTIDALYAGHGRNYFGNIYAREAG